MVRHEIGSEVYLMIRSRTFRRLATVYSRSVNLVLIVANNDLFFLRNDGVWI